MTVSLRTATGADLDAVVALMLDTTRRSYAGVMPAATIAALTPELIAGLWRQTLSGEDSGAAVVAVDCADTVVGVTRFAADDGVGTVHSLYVSPDAQRRGIGARLLEFAASRLREWGATTLRLWVFADNAASVTFYRSQGWQPDGHTRTQPGFDVTELRLEYTGLASADSAILAAAAREVLDRPNAPAGVAIGLRGGGRELTAVAGSRSPAGDPMTLGTVHDLASITKVLGTTTALIRLVTIGAVRLHDRVVDYLPEFRGGAKDTVTVRQLLTHRGGLWEWQPLYLGGRDREAALRHAQRLPLRYPPDTERHYSDLGFILLGRIVEVASGMDLATAVRTLVTEPLGMTATGYAPVGDDVAHSALNAGVEQRMVATGEPYPVLDADPGFDGWRQRPIVGEVNDGNAFHALAGVSGHAGLFSTLDDLLCYASALARYFEHLDLWDPSVVEAFLHEGPDPEQALGFRRYPFTVDGRTVTMYGHPGFVGCVVGFAPEAELALAVCSNRLVRTDAASGLTAADLLPNDELWDHVRAAASAALDPTDEQKPRG